METSINSIGYFVSYEKNLRSGSLFSCNVWTLARLHKVYGAFEGRTANYTITVADISRADKLVKEEADE